MAAESSGVSVRDNCTACCYQTCPRRCRDQDRIHQIEPVSSWFRLLAVFFTYAMVPVTESTFGLVYDPLMEKYGATRGQVGWALSLYMVVGLITGMFAGPLYDVFGIQLVSFVGSCLWTLGLALSSVAPNLVVFVFFYGFVAGLGWMVTFLGGTTLVQKIFIYNNGFANGFITLGFTAGTALSPLLMDFLLETYSLTGAILLTSGLVAHTLVLSIAFSVPKTGKTARIHIAADEDHTDDDRDATRMSSFDVANYDVSSIKRSHSDSEIKSLRDSDSVNDHVSDVRTEMQRQESSTLLEGEAISPANNKEKQDEISSNQETIKTSTVKVFLKSLIDFSLCRLPTYVLVNIFCTFMFIARMSLLAHVPGAARHRGMPARDAAMFVSVMGFSNFVFRIMTTILVNFRWMNVFIYSAVGTMCLAASSFLAIFAKTKGVMTSAMILLGLFEGFTNTVLSLVVLKIVGTERFARGMGLVFTLTIPAPLIAAPFSGWLVDITGDYIATFALGTASALTAVVIMIIIYILSRKKQKPENCQTTIVIDANKD